MKIEVKTEENLFKIYLSKIITSAFESGLVVREKRFRPEIISNDLLDIINHSKSKTREEIIMAIPEEMKHDPETDSEESKTWIAGFNNCRNHILNKLKKVI